MSTTIPRAGMFTNKCLPKRRGALFHAAMASCIVSVSGLCAAVAFAASSTKPPTDMGSFTSQPGK